MYGGLGFMWMYGSCSDDYAGKNFYHWLAYVKIVIKKVKAFIQHHKLIYYALRKRVREKVKMYELYKESLIGGE